MDEKLRERQIELIKILEALNSVLKSSAWQTLEEMVFQKLVERLDRQLLSEARNPKIETDKLYLLQGERNWANRFADLRVYGEQLKKELAGINLKLKQ